MKQLTIASSLVALLVGGGALAQTAQQQAAQQPQAAQPQNAAMRDYCADGFVPTNAPQSGTMTKDQTRQMADGEFAAIDRNSDGRLSLAEFASCVARAGSGLHPAGAMGGGNAESDDVFARADANQDGKLDAREYLKAAEQEFGQQSAAANPDAVPVYFIWVPASGIAALASSGSDDTQMTANQAAAHAAMAFKNQDTNGDGTVSRAEWQAGNQVMNPDLVEQRFKMLDMNRDGMVDKDEYAANWAQRFNDAQQAQQTQGGTAQASAVQGGPQGESVPVWVLYVY